MDLADRLYDLADLLPKHEMYGLGSQIRRAAVSVPANIAEGHGRDHLGDYLRHLSFSLGSIMELDTLVGLARRRRYIPDDIARSASEEINRVGRMLSGLVSSSNATIATSTQHPTPNTQHPTPAIRR